MDPSRDQARLVAGAVAIGAVYGIKGTPVPNTTMVKDNDGVWRASDEYLKAYADAFVKRIPDAQKVQVIPSLIKGRGHELTDNIFDPMSDIRYNIRFDAVFGAAAVVYTTKDNVQHIAIHGVEDMQGIQASIALDSHGGSQELKDVAGALKAPIKSSATGTVADWPGKCRSSVFDGFFNRRQVENDEGKQTYASLQDEVIRVASSLDPSLPIEIDGHSLGGAMAGLFAAQLDTYFKSQGKTVKFTITGFAAHKAFNQQFGDEFDKRHHTARNVSIESDLVPNLSGWEGLKKGIAVFFGMEWNREKEIKAEQAQSQLQDIGPRYVLPTTSTVGGKLVKDMSLMERHSIKTIEVAVKEKSGELKLQPPYDASFSKPVPPIDNPAHVPIAIGSNDWMQGGLLFME